MSIRSSILYRINFKVLISILYIVILIVAQLETLEFIILPEKLSYFCKVHQYGIVIMYAFDKIVDAIKGHKAHKELVRDIDAEREEGLKAEHEARVAKRAKKKEERKIAKQKAHLLKQGKQEDEVQI